MFRFHLRKQLNKKVEVLLYNNGRLDKTSSQHL
nr:MAG TPA: hypothetical protein [Caudoviricetes sp.]